MAPHFKCAYGKLGRVVVLLASIIAVLTAPHANAGEGTFGWIYTLDLQPKGSWEAE